MNDFDNNELALTSKIEDILLDFAALSNQVDTSDLQSIASTEAEKIIKLIRGY